MQRVWAYVFYYVLDASDPMSGGTAVLSVCPVNAADSSLSPCAAAPGGRRGGGGVRHRHGLWRHVVMLTAGGRLSALGGARLASQARSVQPAGTGAAHWPRLRRTFVIQSNQLKSMPLSGP